MWWLHFKNKCVPLLSESFLDICRQSFFFIMSISFHAADEESAISDRILSMCVSRKNLYFCSWHWLVSSEPCASDRKLLQQSCSAAFFFLLKDHWLIPFQHKFESAASNVNIPGLQGFTHWCARKLVDSTHHKKYLVYSSLWRSTKIWTYWPYKYKDSTNMDWNMYL